MGGNGGEGGAFIGGVNWFWVGKDDGWVAKGERNERVKFFGFGVMLGV